MLLEEWKQHRLFINPVSVTCREYQDLDNQDNGQMHSMSTRWREDSILLPCESEVTQSCPTLPNPMDCSPPGSSIHGIFQARVLEPRSKVVLVYSVPSIVSESL